MSWDAWLTDDRGHSEGDWNYTHNCNGMITAALLDIDGVTVISPAWWEVLDGMPGPAGADFLDHIIRGLAADPAKYKAMNPENGWGDYDSLLKVLTEMRNAVPEWPTTWATSG